MKKFLLLAGMVAIFAMTASATVGDLPVEPPTDYITDPMPGVEPEILIKSGYGYYPYQGQSGSTQMGELPSDGSLTKMLRDGDKMYLSNIFSWVNAPGWIEGTVKDNKVTFNFPQLVNEYWEDIKGVMTKFSYYAVACELVIKNGNGDMVPTTEQVMTFTIQDDGTLVPEKSKNDKDLYLCEWTKDSRTWEWTYGGDSYIDLNLQKVPALEVPANVEFKKMCLIYPHAVYGGTYAHEVQVGFDGNDCYVKGMAVGISDLQDAAIKGKRSGDVISFNSNEFIGNSWLFRFTQYLIGGDTELVNDPNYGTVPNFTEAKNLEFVYNPETEEMISDMSFIIVPSPQENFEDLYYENIYFNPNIVRLNEGPVTALINPDKISYVKDKDYKMYIFDFAVSQISADNQLLDMSKLYFEMLIDGVPLEINKDIDPTFSKPTTLIKFGRNDYQCFVRQEDIVQMVALPTSKVSFNKLTLRLVYDPESENPVYSESILIGDDSSAVESINDNQVIATFYIDMQGRACENPSNGVYIRAQKMTDGSVRYSKAVVH